MHITIYSIFSLSFIKWKARLAQTWFGTKRYLPLNVDTHKLALNSPLKKNLSVFYAGSNESPVSL